MSVMVAVIFLLPFIANAQATVDPLRAAIWTSLLSDPRSANIPPAQMQLLVDQLAQKAEAQNMSVQDILWRPAANQEAAAVVATLGCEQGVVGYICSFNQAFGFSGTNYTVPLALLVTSGLLIVIIWEMIVHRRKKLAIIAASAPPWENMPQ